jgi:hypothetical protein
MSLDRILISIFLLLPPLVLWRCKKLCEKHPSTIVFRSVPLGCLTILLLPVFLGIAIAFLCDIVETQPRYWIQFILDKVLYLAILIAGIAVIVYLSKRFSKGRETPSIGLHVAVFIGCAIIAMIISVISSPNIDNLEAFDKTASWRISYFPCGGDVHVAFEQHPSHPFLAEYDYRLRLRHGREKRYFYLWPNTGGRTFINVYKLDDGRLFLKDKDVHYLVNAGKWQVFILNSSSIEQYDAVYAVPLSDKKIDSFGGGKNIFNVDFVDGTRNTGMPIEIDLKKKIYIGCIMDNFFCSASEQPEGEEHPAYRERK